MQARPAVLFDTIEIARIYARCAKERSAFDRPAADDEQVRTWLAPANALVVVAEGDTVMGFALAMPDKRWGDAKSAELVVAVDAPHRRRGVARTAMEELVRTARVRGFWKIVGYAPADNAPFRGLVKALGFREVGTFEKHVNVGAGWRDVVVVERLLMARRPSNPAISV
jgi:phosphinothricin acetyltransferase